MSELRHTALQHAGIATHSPPASRNCYLNQSIMQELLKTQSSSMQELLHTALEHAGLAKYAAPSIQELLHIQPFSVQ